LPCTTYVSNEKGKARLKNKKKTATENNSQPLAQHMGEQGGRHQWPSLAMVDEHSSWQTESVFNTRIPNRVFSLQTCNYRVGLRFVFLPTLS
jgi:hypothetical protein